jgi:hypothetical protein
VANRQAVTSRLGITFAREKRGAITFGVVHFSLSDKCVSDVVQWRVFQRFWKAKRSGIPWIPLCGLRDCEQSAQSALSASLQE